MIQNRTFCILFILTFCVFSLQMRARAEAAEPSQPVGPSPSAGPLRSAVGIVDEQSVYLAIREQTAPSVVRIETAGGDETVGENVSIREITGVFLTSDGFIVSSAVGFAHHPDAIVVVTQDGTHHSARVICTDLNRKLTLLKIEGTGFSVLKAAALSKVQSGQKILTLGRVLNPETPSMTTGIVSGLNRIRGLAIQTDAHVSPDNYGGPLLNLDGEALGILTPFGMGENELFTGVELYDSGVGFAVPMEQIFAILPRMKEAFEKSGSATPAELRPAPKVGLTFRNPAPTLAESTVLYVHPDTLASSAGIQAGDRILAVDGTPISRGSDFQAALAKHWEGDSIQLTILRKTETIQMQIQLINLEKNTKN